MKGDFFSSDYFTAVASAPKRLLFCGRSLLGTQGRTYGVDLHIGAISGNLLDAGEAYDPTGLVKVRKWIRGNEILFYLYSGIGGP